MDLLGIEPRTSSRQCFASQGAKDACYHFPGLALVFGEEKEKTNLYHKPIIIAKVGIKAIYIPISRESGKTVKIGWPSSCEMLAVSSRV